MKYLAIVAGLLSCIVVLAACGTYRQITDDYKSDYYVQSVRPGQGVSGEEVTFQSKLCVRSGGLVEPESPNYYWDFGGGAYPNTSYDKEPQVTLRDGLRSPYHCKLVVSSGCEGGERLAEYEFDLQIAPLTVLAVTPTNGVGDGQAVFSALIGSGNAKSYMWDFGGAGTPGGSNLPNPTIKFNNVAVESVYQCRVIVSNNFESTEFPFTITLQPKPAAPAT
jgi:hypothetical protein